MINKNIIQSINLIDTHCNSATSEHVKNIHRKSRYNQWVHINSSYFFQRISYCIAIPQILLNSVFAVTNLQSSGNIFVTYSVTCFLLFNAFLVGIREFLKLDKKVEFHKNLAILYEKLANDIEENLSKSEFTEEIGDILKKFSELIMINESLPPSRIIKNADKIFHKYANLKTIETSQYKIDIPQFIDDKDIEQNFEKVPTKNPIEQNNENHLSRGYNASTENIEGYNDIFLSVKIDSESEEETINPTLLSTVSI